MCMERVERYHLVRVKYQIYFSIMDGLRFRPATLCDKDGVLAIRDNIYDGLDYLPAYYDYFLTLSNVKAYVCQNHGEIIAFSAAFLVDDGYTVISRAGRVAPQYSGLKVYSMLKAHVLMDSGAVENSFTAINSNDAVFTESFMRENRQIVNKFLDRYNFNPLNIDTKAPPYDLLKAATGNDLKIYMLSELHRKYLFPDDVIIVDWVPYRLLPSNIPLLGVLDKTNMLTNVEIENGNQSGLLSIATVFPTKDTPFTANLDIYGADSESLEIHIATQIEYLKKHANDTLSLLVFCEEVTQQRAIERAFDRFGIKRFAWKNSRQMVFRKYIK